MKQPSRLSQQDLRMPRRHQRARSCRISVMEILRTLQDRLEHLELTDRQQILVQVYRHIRRHRQQHRHSPVSKDHASQRVRYSRWILKSRISLKIQENKYKIIMYIRKEIYALTKCVDLFFSYSTDDHLSKIRDDF